MEERGRPIWERLVRGPWRDPCPSPAREVRGDLMFQRVLVREREREKSARARVMSQQAPRGALSGTTRTRARKHRIYEI